MVKVDMRAYRTAQRWRIEETEQTVFLIDAVLPDPNTEDTKWLIEHADHLLGRIRTTLQMEAESIKDKERKAQVNVWIYSPEVLRTAGLVVEGTPHMFYGTANVAGVHLVTLEMAWNEPLVFDKVTHEMVHYVWCEEVGEAPSLLNEGIATYFECLLATDAADRLAGLKSMWQKYAVANTPGSLRRLCRNDAFWEASGAGGEPMFMMYSVGAELIAYLLGNHGMQSVRQIFLNSHFDDPHLARRIEEVTGESIDLIEQCISRRTGVA